MKKSNSIPAGMDDYQAQDDLHTLTRAEEVKADAKRHARALEHGKKKVAAMQAVVAKAVPPTKRAAKVNRASVI
jgi:hypothetical protein